jgi:DNA-binding transcriptional ArsR family regulator
MSQLLNLILGKVDRGDCRQRRWPDHAGNYWPLNPLRDDKHSGSFKVSERGHYDFATETGGGLRDLARALGLSVDALTSEKKDKCRTSGLTLEVYADAKKLEPFYLDALGVQNSRRSGGGVEIPYYYAEDDAPCAVRYRVSMSGPKRFLWRKGDKPALYGLWMLRHWRDTSGHAVRLLLVEGESDAQTLWRYGFPALGIPGASSWQGEWAAHLEGFEVYLWLEPDEAAKRLLASVAESLPEVRVIQAPSGRKDISECHVAGDDVPTLVQTLMAAALTAGELRAGERRELRKVAFKQAAELLRSQNLLSDLQVVLAQLGLVSEERNAKVLYLALTSRLLERPVNIVVKGPSSGGKSFLVGTVLKAFPAEAYVEITAMSDKALVYDTEDIAHRFLIIYEATGMGKDFPAYSLRSLLSEGQLRYLTVVKGEGGPESCELVRQGPTGLITTTTAVSLHPENETRHLSLTVSDDPLQTKAILQRQAQEASLGVEQPNLDSWLALQQWLAAQERHDVTVPYAGAIADLVGARAVRLRRDFAAVLQLIKAHALLHRNRRAVSPSGAVEATLADYAAVRDLIGDILSEGVSAAVSSAVRETVATVNRLCDEESRTVSVSEVARALGVDKAAASRRVSVAERAGYLVKQDVGRGKPCEIQPGNPLPDDEAVLPTVEQIEHYLHTLPKEGQRINAIGVVDEKLMPQESPGADTMISNARGDGYAQTSLFE